MRTSVRDAFYDFNVPFEGAVPFLYQDVKGLVSIGVGILADPLSLCLALPLVHKDGAPATTNEISAEWLRIKDLPPDRFGRTAAQRGHLYAEPFTTLRLTDAGLRSSLDKKLEQMDDYLRMRFSGYEQWPADAQLAVLSLSWACGPAFRFPRLEAALSALDFEVCATEIRMDETGNPGLVPRNKANHTLMLNAAYSAGAVLDPDMLFWPRDMSSMGVDPAPDTQPAPPDSAA